MTSFEAIVEAHLMRWVTGHRLAVQADREQDMDVTPRKIPPPITFSLAYGCGADDIVKQVSDRLSATVYDRQIIEAISRDTKVRARIIEALDAGDRKEIPTFTEQMFGRHSIDDEIYFQSLASVVRTFSMMGPSIFIGRGACHLLADTGALNVRIVAGFKERVLRVVQFEGMGLAEARKRVEAQDQMRRGFIKQYFNRDIDDPAAYHLCLNAARIRSDKAADMILKIHRSLRKMRLP